MPIASPRVRDQRMITVPACRCERYSAGVTTVSSVIPALVQTGDRVIVDSEADCVMSSGWQGCISVSAK